MNNRYLYQKIKQLTQLVFHLYDENLGPLDSSLTQNNSSTDQVFYPFNYLIADIPEFFECVNLMREDENIKALEGAMVGSLMPSSKISNIESCIFSFISRMYLEGERSYSIDLFNKNYEKFEDLFYSDELEYTNSVDLYNFEYDGHQIELDSQTFIKRGDDSSIKANREHSFMSYSYFSRSFFFIETKYKHPKYVYSPLTEDFNENPGLDALLNHAYDVFDLVIATLRLFKHSAVYRSHTVTSVMTTFHPFTSRLRTSTHYQTIAIGEKVSISDEEGGELSEIFKYVSSSAKDKRFSLALRRLSLGMERLQNEDKLIDYFIGLESLYSSKSKNSSGSDNLKLNLALSSALVLEDDLENRRKIFDFVMKTYKIRNDIVHGKEFNLMDKDVLETEELLRRSLKLWIKDKGMFDKDKLINLHLSS